jgi:zinc/manganese transport system substrate-binding protein/manganese/iron transport system substrate-binding protein
MGVACGGGGEKESDSGKLRVVAVTTQIGDFARNVGGDLISLTVLLKPNQDAHDFEPEPSQSRRLADAELILANGLGLDKFVEKATHAGSAKVIEVTSAVSAHVEDGEPDPHVWFDVANAKLMVASIRDALVAADSANAQAYRDNAARYSDRLDLLNAQIKRDVEAVPQSCRKLVTNHDVLGYYAEAYGFKLVAAVIPSISTEARASASDVANVVRQIRAERVPAIFAEASVNPGLIRQVGKEAGVKVIDDLYGDSLGPKGSAGETYTGMMEANTKKIVEALKSCT